MKITSPDLMKINNKRRILEIIYKEKNIYRAQIANLTNMSTQTITNLVKELIEEGIVVETPMKTVTKGRAPIALSINLDKQYSIGIELSVSELNFALYTASGQLLKSMKTKPNHDVLAQVKHCIQILIEEIDKKSLLGIGISAEGIVNEGSGLVISSKDLGLNNVNIIEELKELDIPVLLRHDANVIAETYSYDSEINNMMLVKIDRGIGSSFILNGKILKSKSTVVGELGHVVLYSAKKPKQCRCGKKGCLTTEASIRAIETLFGKTIEEVGKDYQQNDSSVTQSLERISAYIAEPISNLISVLGLEHVILTGKLFEALGNSFFEEVKHHIIKNLESWNQQLKIDTIVIESMTKRCSDLVVKRYYTNERELC